MIEADAAAEAEKKAEKKAEKEAENNLQLVIALQPLSSTLTESVVGCWVPPCHNTYITHIEHPGSAISHSLLRRLQDAQAICARAAPLSLAPFCISKYIQGWKGGKIVAKKRT